MALNTVGAVSAKRVQEIAGSLFDLPISTGTICKMVARCAAKAEYPVSLIKEKILQLEKGHFDETGTRVAGKTSWVHVACDEEQTLANVIFKKSKSGTMRSFKLPCKKIHYLTKKQDK